MSNLKLKKGDRNNQDGEDLPPIPDKIYFSIGEVARLCRLKPHVLRYWEQEFTQLAPSKRRGNRRYYQHKDVLLVRKIRELLHEQGYTIEGARQQLSSHQPKDNGNERLYNAVEIAIADLEQVASDLAVR